MRIDLQLLGRFGATVESRPPRVVQMSAPRRRAVLAYLALQPGQMETRERLAALLWGDDSDHQARQSLRQCLLGLRREFQAAGQDPLVMEGDVVGLDPERFVVDAREFMALASSDAAGDLDRALDLYKGDVLDGFELDVEPFDDWLRGERARIAAAGALERSAASHDAAGNGPGALHAAERLAALDPLREAAQRPLRRPTARVRRCVGPGRARDRAHQQVRAQAQRGGPAPAPARDRDRPRLRPRARDPLLGDLVGYAPCPLKALRTARASSALR